MGFSGRAFPSSLALFFSAWDFTQQLTMIANQHLFPALDLRLLTSDSERNHSAPQ
jgi:hypothetical protein